MEIDNPQGGGTMSTVSYKGISYNWEDPFLLEEQLSDAIEKVDI
jgi:hypothetical protein